MSATSSDETGSSSDERVGELLVRELRWIHGLLRRDLEVVRRLAGDVLTGASAETVRAEVLTSFAVLHAYTYNEAGT